MVSVKLQIREIGVESFENPIEFLWPCLIAFLRLLSVLDDEFGLGPVPLATGDRAR